MTTNNQGIQQINLIDAISRPKKSPISWRIILGSYLLVALLFSAALIVSKSYYAYLKESVSTITQSINVRQKEIKTEQEKPNSEGASYVTTLPTSFRSSQKGFIPLLTELSSHKMEYTWLTEVTFNYATDTIRFTGMTVQPSYIHTLIRTIRQSTTLGKKNFEIVALEKPDIALLNKNYRVNNNSARKDKEKKMLVKQFRQALLTLNPPDYENRKEGQKIILPKNTQWAKNIPYIFVLEHVPVTKTLEKKRA